MSQRPERGAGVADHDMTGQTALVTGSTSGIGREAALALGRLGAEVIVHGRDETAGREVVAQLDRLGANGRFVAADFADRDAVERLTREVSDHVGDGGLDVVANNAGGFFREGRLAETGVEYTLQVNHLAPYLLTAELLPALAPDARVVTTSSGAHRGDQLDWDAVTSIDDYSAWRAYQRSKLANVQFTAELARRFEASDGDRVANCFHPGAIPGSGFFRFLPGPLSSGARVLGKLPFVPTPADGAETLVYLAVGAPSVSGRYFADCAPRTPDDPARDPDAQRRLWRESAALLEIDEPLADAVAAPAEE